MFTYPTRVDIIYPDLGRSHALAKTCHRQDPKIDKRSRRAAPSDIGRRKVNFRVEGLFRYDLR